MYTHFATQGIEIVEDPSHMLDVDEVAQTVANAEPATSMPDAVLPDLERTDRRTEGAEIVDIQIPKAPKPTTKKKAKKRVGGQRVAPLTGDPVRMYLKEIGKVPLLTAAQKSTSR